MWLINVQTMQLEEFMVDPPRYAILSHTWGSEEVTFADFNHPDQHLRQGKAGWRKIENVCRLSRKREYSYRYVWIDTCCIDKSSSAELSEAINSMYAWYAGAELCYAYLEDVPPPPIKSLVYEQHLFRLHPSVWGSCDFGVASAFAGSRWFQRGWTLQELVASRRVYFFGRGWGPIASRDYISHELSLITGIPKAVLGGQANALHYPVGARISWATDRKTTRPEDIAYSLLGLLDINMPLLYGEGSRAFLRLQEEILRQHEDDTIFLWCSRPAEPWAVRGMLANSPSDFGNFREKAYYLCRGIKPTSTVEMERIEPISAFSSLQSSSGVDNRGVWFRGHVASLAPKYSTNETALLYLNCRFNSANPVGLYLELLGPNRYARARPSEVYVADSDWKVDAASRHANVEDTTIVIYKTDSAIRKLVSNDPDAFLDDFSGPENKSHRCQHGFLFRCVEPVFPSGNWAKLVALSICRDIADLGKEEIRFNPGYEGRPWTPFVAASNNSTNITMKFWNGKEEIVFATYFRRVSTHSNGSLGADPGTASHPSPRSFIGLYCNKEDETMTVAQAEGEVPSTLVITNNRGSQSLSITVKLEEVGHLKLWVVEAVEL
ncbi:hypothetical protein GGTG_07277 [Gaeumannomyces tritici R3-111a-1]|uniref:Heterokaryon incompatibility domain-containing protein n=1 Tax=Gaeumannomyces tritici (strain R3-111a-1) TaxID=644352 RepID=J3P180_GAET3|nr:hypothetical protein GGTG_07277 [Gaeumannomyces tritici R3-111a-1]EJT77365.1 hypothetical protein GGTG_07277 [Gaeumannomyces tritici R3-111a-1]